MIGDMAYLMGYVFFAGQRLRDGAGWIEAIFSALLWPLFAGVLAAEDVAKTQAEIKAKKA